MDKLPFVYYSKIMLSGIRIYSSDPLWRQILGDLKATVLNASDVADVNFDALHLDCPVSMMELKAAIIGATDNSKIIRQIFGRDVSLSRLPRQIVVLLYKTGGMSVADLKVALGYSPNATTHTVDTAIYQLRKTYGRDFIQNKDGVYTVGKL